MGYIYKPKQGRRYWIKYYRNGRCIRESSGSESYEYAKKLLRIREGRGAEGRSLGINLEKVTLRELAQDLIHHYEANRSKEIVRAKECKEHLTPFFGEYSRAIEITTSRINEYIVFRQSLPGRKKKPIANGTINRELSILKRMFTLAAQSDPPKVERIPHIPMLKKSPPRTGYFEQDEFLAIRGLLPDHVKVPASIAYYTGMRKSEVLKLRWDQVKFDPQKQEGKIVLAANDVKNETSRTIFFNADLYRVLARAKEIRDNAYPSCCWVSPSPINKTKRLREFRHSWRTAVDKAGLKGRVYHDFRRTAVRDMVRAGVPEKVAMAISGHKTRSVFDRYNIVNEADLQIAAERIRTYHEAQKKASTGIVLGIEEGQNDTLAEIDAPNQLK